MAVTLEGRGRRGQREEGRRGMESCLMGILVSLLQNEFWRLVAQQCEYTVIQLTLEQPKD